MQLLVTESHEGQGEFPLFKKGSAVGGIMSDSDYPNCSYDIWGSYSNPHWLACVIDGQNIFIPDIYVTNGVLNRDYNPTELVVEEGQKVTLLNIVFEWLYVKDETGNEGWLPVNKVVSVDLYG